MEFQPSPQSIESDVSGDSEVDMVGLRPLQLAG